MRDRTTKKAIILRLSFFPIFFPMLLVGVVAKLSYTAAAWFFDELWWAFHYGFRGPK